jgi:hypothetical protein
VQISSEEEVCQEENGRKKNVSKKKAAGKPAKSRDHRKLPARQKEGGQIRASGQYRKETGNAGADGGSCSSVDRSSARGEDRPESCGSVALSDRI